MSEFISLWRKNDRGQLTINTDQIVTVHPHATEYHSFEGSDVHMVDGTMHWVEESTKTITARLGVTL